MIWMQFGGFNSQWKQPSVFNWRYSGTEHCDYHSDKHIVSLFRSSLHPITSDTLETVLAQSGICWYGCMWYNGTVVTVHHGGGPELNLVVHGVPVVYMCTVYQCTKDKLVVVQSGIWCTCGVQMYRVPVYQVHSARRWFGMEASIGFNSRSSLQLELEKMENSSISDWANFAKL